MELSGLYQLIKYLEKGTKLHIGVVFLGNNLNSKCDLPHSHTIHSNPVCDRIKKIPKEYERCLRCRNIAIRKAVRDREAYGALCINGVYEYTHPVFLSDKIVCVIFIGNIITPEGEEKLSLKMPKEEIPMETMERNFGFRECEEIGKLLEGYIVTLIEKYPEVRHKGNPIIENIKSYVESNLEYDLSISDVASLYFYSEVYLGRLFKENVGKSFKEYVNSMRIKRARELLLSDLSVIEIAERVGYNNVTYFNRVFKSETGKTPVEYRKSLN